jgi:predicted CXXCH cytochrome family protein
VLALGLALVAGLVLAGLAVAEGQDERCASCHLPPEATFVARRFATPPTDLAAGHGQAPDSALRCVDCHGGPGPAGRLRSLAMGARDLAVFVAGDYTVLGAEYLPAASWHFPVGDATCRACHGEAVDAAGFENHFHNRLADSPRPETVACARCHPAHRGGDPADGYLREAELAPVCTDCHEDLGGPTDPLALLTPLPPGR